MLKTRAQLQVLSNPLARADRSEASSTAAVLHGSLSVVPIFDVIQWLCTHRQSWIIRLLDQGVDATVTVVEGEPADARWGAKYGQAALVQILEAREGRFELQPLEEGFVRSLRGNWQLTLLSAVKSLDEGVWAIRDPALPTYSRGTTPASTNASGNQLSAGLRPMNVQPSAIVPRSTDEATDSAPAPHPDASQLIDLGFASLKSGDTDRARALWRQALQLDPDNRALQFNLRKLDALSNGSE